MDVTTIIKSIDDFPSTSTSSSTKNSIWNETIEYPALRVPVHATARVRQQLKSMLWRHSTTRSTGGNGRPNIYPDPLQPSDYRILILQKQQPAKNQDSEKEAENNNSNQELLIQKVLEQNKDIDITTTTFSMDFTYDDYNVEQALRKIFPVELHAEIPCSFESVGPIAHVNLRSPYEPYKFWIGKILLDKNQPRIQTVVTKIGSIDNEYRTFGMQIIAQQQQRQQKNKSPNDTPNSSNGNNKNDDYNNDWSIVTVKEEKCTFTLDFQKVYWNSRLAGEHRRMVQEIQKYVIAKRQQQQQQRRRQAVSCSSQSTTAEQQQQQQQADADAAAVVVVADLMAGVGPFAIPLTAPATVQKKKKMAKKNKSPKNNKHNNAIIMGDEERSCQPPNSNNNIIRVYANDLNPDSYKYLKINAKQNKCHCDDLICSNQDARALLAQLQKDQVIIDHVIMNLPASAPEFLDMFRGYNTTTNTTTSPAAALSSTEEDDKVSKPPSSSMEAQEQKQPAQSSSSSSSSCLLPRIHVYCFAPKPPAASQMQESTNSNLDAKTDFNQTTRSKSGAAAASNSTANNDHHHHDYQESLDRCAKALGIDSLDRERDNVHIHVVRDVSPQKNMICISFQLPFQVTTLPSVAFTTRPTTETVDDNDSGIHGIPTEQPLRKGLSDDDNDDKRKRSLDPKAKTTCSESKAETDPNKRSKGATIH